MDSKQLAEKANDYLQRLCVEIPDRRVGSRGNREATDFFVDCAASFGFQTDCDEFDCMDWTQDRARLSTDDETYQVFASPYTSGGRGKAPLVVVSTLEELKSVEFMDKILLVRGDLTKEPLMPKNFPFYNPDEHREIIRLLEMKRPLGIAAATSHNPQMAGGVYPFPLIEDGDFDIPSVYLTEEEGNRLAAQAGREVFMEIIADRIPSKGCNVITRKGRNPERRIVFLAHIDAKAGTPGALDNAAGVTTLLLLAELLKDYSGDLELEITAINGEDYYSNPGEVHFLKSNEESMGKIYLGVNLDGLGYQKGNTAYSMYGCPEAIAASIHTSLTIHKGLVEGEQWYQGDHMLFVLNGVPALALTSESVAQVIEITHTAKDRPELVDPAKLVGTALALHDLVTNIG
jgi:aminopeptidase YwaD